MTVLAGLFIRATIRRDIGMRIMALDTGELIAAVLKTGALHQAIRLKPLSHGDLISGGPDLFGIPVALAAHLIDSCGVPAADSLDMQIRKAGLSRSQVRRCR